MIIEDYPKFDVLFRLGMPLQIPQFHGKFYPLVQVLQAIEQTDPSFPLIGYNHNQRRWACSSGAYDRQANAFIWEQCVMSAHTFKTILRQAGWDINIEYWESLEVENDPDTPPFTTTPADPPPPINEHAIPYNPPN